MASSSGRLQFSFSSHRESILCKMKSLREEGLFCDITLILGRQRGSAGRLVRFHGHRVVLAATSHFLRDQFLLHEGQTELSVGVVSSSKVAEALLQSCYTGLLEVNLRELISFLAAASALQMNEAVDKCTQAISRYLRPTQLLFFPKEKGDQQPDDSWPDSTFGNWQEMDAVQPSSSIQEDKTKGGGASLNQAAESACQESGVDNPKLGEIKDCREHSRTQFSGGQELDIHTSEAVKGADEPVQTNGPADAAEIFFESISIPLSIRCSDQVKSEDSPHKEHAQISEKAVEAAEHQQNPDPFNSEASEKCVPQSVEDMAVDSNSVLVQRPYLCRRCDKIFQHLEGYVGHLKVHRQHSCLLCGEGFTQKSQLTHHIRVHTGLKPFRCPLCHKTFTQKALLQDHLQLHTAARCALHLTHEPGVKVNRRVLNGLKGLLDGAKEEGLAG